MILNSIYIAVGGFLGAISRYGVGKWFTSKNKGNFPLGTFVVNIVGSFLLGMITGSQLSKGWTFLLGTGFMGAFTTFSTFNVENVQLALKKERNLLVINLLLSYGIGIILAFLGFILGVNLAN